MTTYPNIRFAYMYRDPGNYKLHGEVIFSNEKQIAVDEIRKQIHSFLSDGLFFITQQVHVEERFFDVVSHDDHPWHEVVTVEATSDPTFDRSLNTSVTLLNFWRTWRRPITLDGMR